MYWSICQVAPAKFQTRDSITCSKINLPLSRWFRPFILVMLAIYILFFDLQKHWCWIVHWYQCKYNAFTGGFYRDPAHIMYYVHQRDLSQLLLACFCFSFCVWKSPSNFHDKIIYLLFTSQWCFFSVSVYYPRCSLLYDTKYHICQRQ